MRSKGLRSRKPLTLSVLHQVLCRGSAWCAMQYPLSSLTAGQSPQNLDLAPATWLINSTRWPGLSKLQGPWEHCLAQSQQDPAWRTQSPRSILERPARQQPVQEPSPLLGGMR